MNMKRVHFGKRSRASNLFNAALTEEENNTPPRYNMKMKPSFNFTASSIQPRLQTLAEGLDDEKENISTDELPHEVIYSSNHNQYPRVEYAKECDLSGSNCRFSDEALSSSLEEQQFLSGEKSSPTTRSLENNYNSVNSKRCSCEEQNDPTVYLEDENSFSRHKTISADIIDKLGENENDKEISDDSGEMSAVLFLDTLSDISSTYCTPEKWDNSKSVFVEVIPDQPSASEGTRCTASSYSMVCPANVHDKSRERDSTEGTSGPYLNSYLDGSTDTMGSKHVEVAQSSLLNAKEQVTQNIEQLIQTETEVLKREEKPENEKTLVRNTEERASFLSVSPNAHLGVLSTEFSNEDLLDGEMAEVNNRESNHYRVNPENAKSEQISEDKKSSAKKIFVPPFADMKSRISKRRTTIINLRRNFQSNVDSKSRPHLSMCKLSKQSLRMVAKSRQSVVIHTRTGVSEIDVTVDKVNLEIEASKIEATKSCKSDLKLLTLENREIFEDAKGLLDSFEQVDKIGEGAFSEVFRVALHNSVDESEKRVLKVMPLSSGTENDRLNADNEYVITDLLSKLCPNFVQLYGAWYVTGAYPRILLDAWERFSRLYPDLALNCDPSCLPDETEFCVLSLEDAGFPLDQFVFTKFDQVVSTVQQIACSIAMAEQKLQFEHRDLHMSNVLVSPTRVKRFSYSLSNETGNRNKTTTVDVNTRGVKATIIDYTLSRLLVDNQLKFNDLSGEENADLFVDQIVPSPEGTSSSTCDYNEEEKGTIDKESEGQFKVYKFMRTLVNNDWGQHVPETNVFWMHHIVDRLLYGRDRKAHLSQCDPVKRERLKKVYSKMSSDQFKSCVDLVQKSDLLKI